MSEDDYEDYDRADLITDATNELYEEIDALTAERDALEQRLGIAWEGLDNIIGMESLDEIHRFVSDLMDKIEGMK